MLVDSHCHLDFPDLAGELDAVVARARAAGVGTLVTIGTKLSEAEKVIAIAERFPDVWATVGVHPHEAAVEPGEDTARLIELARHPKVVGIGETGLDYFYEHSPRDRQAVCFRAHIAAARETGLPLIVHSRDADADTAAILAEEMEQGAYTGLLHCFSSSVQLAEQAVKLGLYISFSGILTFKSANAVREAAQAVPEDRLLIETDAPYLAPVPMRGKRNEPAFVVHTAMRLAELRGTSAAELESVTTANFHRLFRKVATT
jgi:TatD DNase family protein